MSKFQDLLSQIESFIKKYYKNEMVKGCFLFFIIFLASFLVVTTLEYFGRFSPATRTVLFWLFVLSNGLVLYRYIITPLLKLAKIGNRLSLNEASRMIGQLFPDVSDKLHNTLQLSHQLEQSNTNVELLQASIQQRARNLSAIPFTTGIQIGENRKYLKYLLPVLIVICAVLFFRPGIFSDGSNRIINYSKEFVEEAPFDFMLMSNDSLMQGQTYELLVKLKGNEIPSEVKIVSNNGTYNLKKNSNVEFTHEFANLDEDLTFYCEANGFRSKSFKILVLQKPTLTDVSIKLNFPKHTGMTSQVISDLSDMSIPEGTLLEWNIGSENTTMIKSLFTDTTIESTPNANREFKFKKGINESQVYSLVLSTSQIHGADTLNNTITAIPDEFPTISIVEREDSLRPFSRFIEGTISDDYGFSNLSFVTKITREDSVELKRTKVNISAGQTNQIFAYDVDLKKYSLAPGEALEYFFTVSDNDAPNGYKTTSSKKMLYSVPELSDLDNELAEKSETLKKDIDKTLKDAIEIRKEAAKIKNDLINKTKPDWKDKQNINNMINRQEDLQIRLELMKEQFEQNAQQQNEFLENSEELLEKQALLEKLMEELLDDEMKELLEELKEMMDEMNRDEILEAMEDMEQQSGDLEKELDRTLELFKHLELDEKMESIEEQLRELAEEQLALQEETESKSESSEELKEKQEDLNEKFDEIKEDIEDAQEMNDELEQPKNIDFDKEKEEEISNEMNDAKEKLGDGKEKKASDSQQKAGDMMEQMADDIQAMMAAASGEQQTEDMDELRFLLENIIALSHQQEDLMDEYGTIKRTNPRIIGLNREQLKIMKSTEVVKDSLLSLAKRNAQMSNTIVSDLNDLEYNLGKAKEYGQERQIGKVKRHQQYAVTSYNDLALLLSEVLKQMQSQMQSQMSGSGSCNKPGGSGKGSGKDKPGQMSMEQMKNQLKKQMEKMKKGSSPGDKGKPGKGKGSGKTGEGNGSLPGMSPKEVAKMALEQAQMRKALQQLRQELNKDGSGAGNGLNQLIKDMELLENDLLNNGYSNDILQRQKNIMTRLLESEKALLERGYSEERESKSGKNNEEGNQKELKEYTRKKESEIELLRTVPVGLRVYYKNMVNTYFNAVNN